MDKSRRRRQILDAARRLFASRGYHETAVSDIIDAAGIARGTFYLYFESKRAIFDELLDEFLAIVQHCVKRVEVGPHAPPPYDQLRGNLSRVMTVVLDQREMTRIILNHAVGLDRAADEKLDSFYDHLAGALERALETARAFGVASADPTIGARLFLGGIREVVAYLLKYPADRDQVVDEVLRLCLRGVMGGTVHELQSGGLVPLPGRTAGE